MIAVFITFRYGEDFSAAKVRQLAENSRGKFEGMHGFRFGPNDPELLELRLQSNERFIRASSRDTYWTLYFLLTGGAK